jgi:hypothetical protein
MLALGMTREQIIRQMAQGKPTVSMVPVIKEYIGIITEAEKEMNVERQDLEESENMKEEIRKRKEDETMGRLQDIDTSDLFNPNDPFTF